jgi:hypothetical protein
VQRDRHARPLVQLFNWLTGAKLPGSTSSGITKISATLHANQLIEDSSLVYLAPEAIWGSADGGSEMDVFSLGALTYLLFTGRPPAESLKAKQCSRRFSTDECSVAGIGSRRSGPKRVLTSEAAPQTSKICYRMAIQD